MSAVVHSYRYSLFQKEVTYELHDAELTVRREGDDAIAVPYDAIRSVHLKYYGANSYVCELRTDSRRVVLANRHFVRYGEFEDRGESFVRFVESLHRRLRPHADRIRFRAGSNLMWMFGIFGMLFCVAFAVCLLTIPGKQPMTPRLGAKMAGLMFVIAAMSIPMIGKGRTKGYRVEAIPTIYLPETAGPVAADWLE